MHVPLRIIPQSLASTLLYGPLNPLLLLAYCSSSSQTFPHFSKFFFAFCFFPEYFMRGTLAEEFRGKLHEVCLKWFHISLAHDRFGISQAFIQQGDAAYFRGALNFALFCFSQQNIFPDRVIRARHFSW